MSEDQIVEELRRTRNDCSELLEICCRLKTESELNAGDVPSRAGLEAVATLLARIVPALRALPVRPCAAFAAGPKRATATALLREIGELLECALVVERELREYGSRPPVAGANAYARVAMEARS